jgi:hypothetical protein
MSAERTAEEWGRVAVSLPGWRWMPGMGLLPLPNEVEQRNRDNQAVGYFRYGGHTKDGPTVTHVRPSRIRRHVNLTKGHYHPVRAYFVPDPCDPATAGCLLSLFGGAADVRVGSRDWVSPWNVEIAVLGVDGRHHTIRQPTLGRACIAAAEALGRWPGGGR